MRRKFWPHSLAARAALALLIGLAVVQTAGLVIHILDRREVQRASGAKDLTERVVGIYRTVVLTPATQRAGLLAEISHSDYLSAVISQAPPTDQAGSMPAQLQQIYHTHANGIPIGPSHTRWRALLLYGSQEAHPLMFAFHLPDGHWLHVSALPTHRKSDHGMFFIGTFLVMTTIAGGITLWTISRFVAPVRALAAAAEALGRDVNAPPLAESGPTEVARAAAAFNQMATRIRRFVADRTELLTAIGHDLRTPITRLKLRAEFMEDDEQRAKMLVDLGELETMVSATLAFGRDARSTEPVVQLDLADLLRTILDEAGDIKPDVADRLGYVGPQHLTLRGQALNLKRALTNLVTNAVNYGGSAQIRLHEPASGLVKIDVMDTGPGIPPEEIDRVFEPFHRGDQSRNKETGGVGLGLPIARNILRAHGGDVVLKTQQGGGVRATVTLPV